jgi:hypothetical protein
LPAQTGVLLDAVAEGNGFTTTFTEVGAVQLLTSVTVTIYVPLAVTLDIDGLGPVHVPGLAGPVQLYDAPVALELAKRFRVLPLQIGLLLPAFKLGINLTVTVTVKVAPVQPPDTGVTVYVAVPFVAEGLISVPLILVAPLPEVPPVIPPVTVGAGQLYVVPVGTVPLVISTGVTVKAPPLHIIDVILVMIGAGLTVTLTDSLSVQPLASVTVTSYVPDMAVVAFEMVGF